MVNGPLALQASDAFVPTPANIAVLTNREIFEALRVGGELLNGHKISVCALRRQIEINVSLRAVRREATLAPR
mgnify:CR=1 FL=1